MLGEYWMASICEVFGTAELRNHFNARGRCCSLSGVGMQGEGARVL